MAAPADPQEDWSSWQTQLVQFSQATSCTVTLYEVGGTAVIGPIFSSDVGTVLGHSDFFGADGQGRRFEREVGAQAALRLEPVEAVFLGQLAVVAVPIVMYGSCVGTIVFGWLPLSFASALGAERVASAAGVDGRRLWGVLRVQPPLGSARVQLYARFLSSLVAVHARLRETLREMYATGRTREEYLARISHELRTPLSSVMLRISALLNTRLDDPAQIRTALEAIARNVREESRMVDDIVDTARSRTGQLSITPAPCSLLDVVADAVETIAPQAQAKGVAVAFERAPSGTPAPLVQGDRGRLRQAFWNLLANAVKFTPAGGSVRLGYQCRESMHDITIADSGIGIQPAMLARIFDPFTRERLNNDTGLGLGLAIARHIVELHGGRILVHSEGTGRGTTFTVTLPVRPER